MARRAKEPGEALSLFPFLSILTCLIGTLTLLIAALALRQVSGGQPQEKDVAAAEARLAEYKRIQAQLKADQLAVEELKKRTLEAEERQRQAQRELSALQQARAAREQDARARNEAERLAAEVSRLKAIIDRLTTDIARLKKELAAKQAELASRAKREGATVTVRPSGSASGLRPFFVECTQDSAVIHDAKEQKRVSKSVLKSDPSFAALLGQVKSQPNATVVFLVRSAGLWTYREASAVAEAAGVRHGKLPIVGDGALDLSLFGVREKEPKR